MPQVLLWIWSASSYELPSDESNRAKPNSISKHLPRPGRGPNGAGALVLKRSRGLVCRVAGCPGDCPGGSEMGGAKISAASKSFAGDWWDREGYGGVTQEQWNKALFGFLVCTQLDFGYTKSKEKLFPIIDKLLQKTPKRQNKTKKTQIWAMDRILDLGDWYNGGDSKWNLICLFTHLYLSDLLIS